MRSGGGSRHSRRGGGGRKKKMEQRKQESGFDLRSCANAKLPNYNALFDGNLRHHFENKHRQKMLHKMGMIDPSGRVIDLEKNRAKLAIVEQEFKQAEKAEYMRKKEEQEMRRRVQKKRYEALEKARLAEKLRKMKEDRRIRREILSMASPYHEAILSPSTSPTGGKREAPGRKKKSKTKATRSDTDEDGSSFFLTEEQRQSKLNSIDLDEDFH
eukprot:g4151.t1